MSVRQICELGRIAQVRQRRCAFSLFPLPLNLIKTNKFCTHQTHVEPGFATLFLVLVLRNVD